MTREEAIRIIKIVLAVAEDFEITVQGEEFTEEKCKEAVDMAIKALSSSENPNKWIPLTKRPMTDEEREYYREWSDINGAMIFDCPLPEDGQEVLVSYGGYVMVDTFCKDDGCYFEGVDIDDVQAWMPLPEPYKASPTGAERSE